MVDLHFAYSIQEKVREVTGLKAFNLNIPDLCPVSFCRQPAVKFHLIAGEKCVSANADCELALGARLIYSPTNFYSFLNCSIVHFFRRVNEVDLEISNLFFLASCYHVSVKDLMRKCNAFL